MLDNSNLLFKITFVNSQYNKTENVSCGLPYKTQQLFQRISISDKKSAHIKKVKRTEFILKN